MSLVLFAILNTTMQSCSRKITLKLVLQNCFLFADSLLKIVGIILRQSFSHNWKLLGAFELLLSIFLSVYENCITVSVVVPLVPEPFLNTKDLYKNDYTFVVQTFSFERVSNHILEEYNVTNHVKVLRVLNFAYIVEMLERYFLNQDKEIKYAIVGFLTEQYHYHGVSLVNKKRGTCYHMFPNEEAFSPEPFYFTFASALASSLQGGVSLLQAAGFLRVIETSLYFRDNLLATYHANSLVAKYENESSYEDIENNALKESLIRLGNIQLGIYAGLVIFLSASFVFAVEVSIYYYNKIISKVTVVTSVSNYSTLET